MGEAGAEDMRQDQFRDLPGELCFDAAINAASGQFRTLPNPGDIIAWKGFFVIRLKCYGRITESRMITKTNQR